ncbi:MAG TPA: GAF domain-containing protein [Thermoanaerobaculia bacterium]|nr:GAF domain-containing protein [Thermoanaerobaculia bacterium]
MSDRPPAPTASGLELVAELRSTLDRAGELARVAEVNLRELAERGGDAAGLSRVTELERRLSSAESDVKELASRLVDSEHQGGRLMNLYVATYQLHATLEPAEVQATIAEIAINLLGAEQFVLLLRKDDAPGCDIALLGGTGSSARGAGASEVNGLYGGEIYNGGDPVVDATLADGVLRLGPTADSKALAAVPLRVQNEVVGALVLLKLLDHKPILRAEDRDLLDLLSAHAASALFAARLFATKDRKLRTLESLVKLARGE